MTQENTEPVIPDVAGYIAHGQHCLSRLRNADISPSTQMYASLVQESIAHTLSAIAMILDGQDRAVIPGLPKGYEITTRQTGNGNRKWRYELTGPGMAYSSRYQYDTSETALTAGIQYARENEQQQTELATRRDDAHRAHPDLGEPVSEPVDWAGRTFGELTPDERRRVTAEAADQLQDELARAAPAIGAALSQPLDESVHVSGERIDVYGIANPEVD